MTLILQTAVTVTVIALPAFLLGFAAAAIIANRRIQNRRR